VGFGTALRAVAPDKRDGLHDPEARIHAHALVFLFPSDPIVGMCGHPPNSKTCSRSMV
jgi:hypothetical protein